MSHEDRSSPLSRRRFVQASTCLTALLAGANRNIAKSSSQFDSTPPAPPELISDPPTDLISDLAARLNYDQDAIFAFVREEIRYETYDGVLRGATGALLARAGNSADQSMLLAALFEVAQIPYRFALGPLSDPAKDTLVGEIRPNLEQAQKALDARMIAAFSGDPMLSTPPPEVKSSAEEQQVVLDEALQTAERIRSITTEWYEITTSQIAKALSDSGVTLQQPEPLLAQLEIDRHVWLQVPDGSSWLDHDPSLPAGSSQDSPLSDPTETLDTLGIELFHTVQFRIVAEYVRGGSLQRRDAVTRAFTSDQLINLPVSFMVAPTDAVAELGLSISRQFEGAYSFSPAIVYGTDVEVATTPMVFGSSEASVVSALEELGETPEGTTGPGDGETTGIWYAVDVTSPGHETVTIERTWFDRFSASDRLRPDMDVTSLKPFDVVTSEDGSTAVAGLDRLIVLDVAVARLPLPAAIGDSNLNDTMAMTNIFGPAWNALRETLSIDLEWSRNTASWIATPQVSAFTFRQEDPLAADSPIIVDADLLLHAPATTLFKNASTPSSELPPAVNAGIVDVLAERLLLDPSIWATTQSDGISLLAPMANVGSVFEQTGAEGISIRALTSPEDLQHLDIDAVSAAAIQEALERGMLVVTPEHAVELDGVKRLGWWIIDPATGATRDQMDTGGGSASARTSARTPFLAISFADYIASVSRWWKAIDRVRCLGGTLAMFVGAASLFYLDGLRLAGATYLWGYASWTHLFRTGCTP